MLMHAVAIQPLILHLKDASSYKQNWYTDDSACRDRLTQIKSWFCLLLQIGPSYGYFAEPSKSVLLVKEQHFKEALIIFSDLDIQVSLTCHFLGGYAGQEIDVQEHVHVIAFRYLLTFLQRNKEDTQYTINKPILIKIINEQVLTI